MGAGSTCKVTGWLYREEALRAQVVYNGQEACLNSAPWRGWGAVGGSIISLTLDSKHLPLAAEGTSYLLPMRFAIKTPWYSEI